MPVYQGETSIRFASDHRNLAVLDPLMALSPRTELGSEAEELRSRTLAESVVDKLGLQARLVSPKRVSRVEVLDVVWGSRTAEEAEYAFERADSARYEVTDRTNDTVIGTFTAGENITLNGAIIALKPAAVEHDRLTIAIQSFEKAVEELRSTVQV